MTTSASAFSMRAATDADLAAVLELNQACVPEVGDLTEITLQALTSEADAVVVAHARDGRFAGFYVTFGPGAAYGSVNYRWFADRYDSFVYLDRVAIGAGFRRQGLGSQMYRHVEAHATARWFTLEVNVDPPNDASLAFHAALGFEEAGRQRTPYGTTVSLMVRDLTQA